MDPKLYPTLRFRDADAGMQFLKDAFGFEEHAVYRSDDGRIQHPSSRSTATWSCSPREIRATPGSTSR
jgi:uncharacterized glyoxalase superfamily protein PhnB